jgi:hypothetical protein
MAMMGAVLGVVGGVVQGIGAMQAHNAQAKADEYNAAVAVRNQQVIHEQTAAAIDDQQRADKRDLSAIKVAFASNGLSYTGSATDLMLDTVNAKALGIQRISYRGQLQEIEQTDKQNLDLMGAADERQAAGLSLVSGILGGVSSGISSMSRMA